MNSQRAVRCVRSLREVGRWPRRYLLYRRIHPLWLALSRTFPDICLDPAPHPERAYRLPVRNSYAALYRRVIEVHDGLADVRLYADAVAAEFATLGALAGGLDPTRAAAAGFAARLHTALQAYHAGTPPEPLTDTSRAVSAMPPGTDVDVDAQARWLAQAATAYRRISRLAPPAPQPRTSQRHRHRVSCVDRPSAAVPNTLLAASSNRRAS